MTLVPVLAALRLTVHRKGPLLLALLGLVACDDSEPGAKAPETSSSGPGVAMTKAEDVPVIATPRAPSPDALDALVAAAPKQAPPATGADGGTAIGTDTGVAGEETPVAASSSTARVAGGEVEIQPQLSSPAIEQQARAQIYWSLRKCKGPDGRPPPPESITLAFTLREDGTVDPASVIASAEDDALQKTSECVLRAFSATPFEGPVATRRTPARIRITWPSVD